jgi:hypothetical protein
LDKAVEVVQRQEGVSPAPVAHRGLVSGQAGAAVNLHTHNSSHCKEHYQDKKLFLDYYTFNPNPHCF